MLLTDLLKLIDDAAEYWAGVDEPCELRTFNERMTEWEAQREAA